MTPNQLPPLPDGVTLEDLLIPLRAALETCHDTDWSLRQFKTPISHALAALAQQAQEPFAYMADDVAAGVIGGQEVLLSAAIRGAPGGTFNFPLYTRPQQAQEPLGGDIGKAFYELSGKAWGIAPAWGALNQDERDRQRNAAKQFLSAYTTPPAPQVPAPVNEREAFERWCGPLSELRRSDFDPGRYCHSGVSLAWDAWQARAALQSPAPQTGRWLPIASAPRGSGENGPRSVNDPAYVQPPDLLLIHPEGISVGYYDWYYHPGYGVGASQYEPVWRSRPDGAGLDGVTHWMPLPAAPQTKGQP